MGPIWGRQDPDGPHVDPMNFAISESLYFQIAMDDTTKDLQFGAVITRYIFSQILSKGTP